MPRLFIALPLPPDIAAGLAHALPPLPGLRPVAPELMHVTLAFLGEVGEARVAEVTSATEGAARRFGSFDVELEGVGRFPLYGRPSVVWAGTTRRAADAIVRLGGAVRAELVRGGVPFDAKPLRAHVTLARVRESATSDEATAIASAARDAHLPALAFRATDIHVMESRLSDSAPRYSSRARIPLVGSSR